MFGSYGSYSSMCASSAPLDISSPSNLAAADASCAFPSWPRRDSFDNEEQRPTSYLSDDDLLLCDSRPSAFDDDCQSVSSAGSASPLTAAPIAALSSPNAPMVSQAQLLEMERERRVLQREFVRCLVQEKERRRAVSRKQRRSSPSSSKKSKNMASISEE